MKLSLLFALVLVLALPASAGNIVFNPGFETGDFSGWTVVPASEGSDLTVVSGGHASLWAAQFAADTPDDPDTISQVLTTAPGQTYVLSFWLARPVDGIDYASFLE